VRRSARKHAEAEAEAEASTQHLSEAQANLQGEL